MTVTNTIISILRTTLPRIIANQILSVQPMTGPVGQIFNLRNNSSKSATFIVMNKGLYRTFLRLNDRRKYQTSADFNKAKYFSYTQHWALKYIFHDITFKKWCDEQFGQYGYIVDGRTIWFENENDLTAFRMTWL